MTPVRTLRRISVQRSMSAYTSVPPADGATGKPPSSQTAGLHGCAPHHPAAAAPAQRLTLPPPSAVAAVVTGLESRGDFVSRDVWGPVGAGLLRSDPE